MRVLAALAAVALAIASEQEQAVLSSTEKSADPRVAYNGARTSKSLPLGISNGCVPDEKLTGSSELKAPASDFSASRGRLLLDQEAALHVGWRPAEKDHSPWLEVDLGKEYVVASVATQGGHDVNAATATLGAPYWVSSYNLVASVDGVTWDSVGAGLPGNSDADGIVTRDIGAHSVEPVRARFLRFQVKKCGSRDAKTGETTTYDASAAPSECALRVEVFGYSVCSHGPCHTVRPLGVGLPSKTAQSVGVHPRTLIPDGSIRASSYLAPASAPYVARLNAQPRPFREGGWTPACHTVDGQGRVCKAEGSTTNEHLQVDLGRELEINAVATQGASSRGAWVEKYTLAFSNDGRHWALANKPFSGNADASGVVKNSLPRPVLARYVRIIPSEWEGQEKGSDYALRWELYGPAGYSQEEERAWLQGWPTRGMCRLQRPSCSCGDNAKAPVPLEAPGVKSTCPCHRYTLQLLSRAVHVPAVTYAGLHYGQTLDYMTAALSTLQAAAEFAAATADAKVHHVAAPVTTLRGAIVVPVKH